MAVTAANIRDRASLEAWLLDWSVDSDALTKSSIVIAHRSVMRVAVFLKHRGRLSKKHHARLMQVELWESMISRVASIRWTIDLTVAAAAARTAAAKVLLGNREALAPEATGISAVANFAAQATQNLSSALANPLDDVVEIAGQTANAAASAVSAFLSSRSGPLLNHETADAKRAVVWDSIRADAESVEHESAVATLLSQALWRNMPDWWMKELNNFLRTLRSPQLSGHGFDIWAEWYDANAFGMPIFGIRSEKIRTDLERNIALGSTDGKFNEAFWDRDPAAINSDIKRWVEEARALDAMGAQPTGGLLLEFLKGVLRFRRGNGLAAKGSDRRAVNDQLALLRQMVDRLAVKFSDPNTLVPDDLQFALLQLKSITSRNDPASIGIAELYTASASFRAQVNAAKSPPQGANIFPLDGANLALCESVVLTADMICMATEEGRQQFERADTAERDAGPAEALNELEIELFTLVAEHGQLMEQQDLELIRLFLRSERHSPHPIRFDYFKKETVHGTIYAMLAGSVALGVAQSTFVVLSSSMGVGLLIGAALTLLGNESIKQSEYFKRLAKWNGEKIDQVIDMARDGIKGEMPPGLRKFVLQNKDLFRKIAGKRKSGEPLLTLLDYIERQEREKLGSGEKDDPEKVP